MRKLACRKKTEEESERERKKRSNVFFAVVQIGNS
jgi:hypothetical protein